MTPEQISRELNELSGRKDLTPEQKARKKKLEKEVQVMRYPVISMESYFESLLYHEDQFKFFFRTDINRIRDRFRLFLETIDDDSSESATYVAYSTLVYIDQIDLVPSFQGEILRLTRHPDAMVAAVSIDCCMSADVRIPYKQLISICDSEEDLTRQWAVFALSQFYPKESEAVLANILKADSSEFVRLEVLCLQYCQEKIDIEEIFNRYSPNEIIPRHLALIYNSVEDDLFDTDIPRFVAWLEYLMDEFDPISQVGALETAKSLVKKLLKVDADEE